MTKLIKIANYLIKKYGKEMGVIQSRRDAILDKISKIQAKLQTLQQHKNLLESKGFPSQRYHKTMNWLNNQNIESINDWEYELERGMKKFPWLKEDKQWFRSNESIKRLESAIYYLQRDLKWENERPTISSLLGQYKDNSTYYIIEHLQHHPEDREKIMKHMKDTLFRMEDPNKTDQALYFVIKSLTEDEIKTLLDKIVPLYNTNPSDWGHTKGILEDWADKSPQFDYYGENPDPPYVWPM